MFRRLLAACGYVPKEEYDELYRNSQRLLFEYREFRDRYEFWLMKYQANQPPNVPANFTDNIIPFRKP